MNNSLIIRAVTSVLFIVCTLAFIGCTSAPKMDSAINASTVSIRVYEVFGMDCPGCHGGLEKLIQAIPGVTGAEASWVAKRLSVTIAEGMEVTDDTIHEAIKSANFTPGKRLK